MDIITIALILGIVVGTIQLIIWINSIIKKYNNKVKAEKEQINKIQQDKQYELTEVEKDQLIKNYESKYRKLENDFIELKQKTTKKDFKKILKKSIKQFNNYQRDEFHNILNNYDRTIDTEIDEDKNIKAEIAYMQARAYYIELYYKNSLLQAKKAAHLNPQNTEYLLFYAQRLDEKGSYDKALKLFNKALEIELPKLGDKHETIALYYNEIGAAYDNKGEYDQAIEFYQKALKIDLEILGEKHPSTATSYNNIGSAYDHKGEYDLAIEFYQKALKIRLEILGEKHPSTATSYNNIGFAYFSKKDIDKAIEYLTLALDIVKELNDRVKIQTIEGNLKYISSFKK